MNVPSSRTFDCSDYSIVVVSASITSCEIDVEIDVDVDNNGVDQICRFVNVVHIVV